MNRRFASAFLLLSLIGTCLAENPQRITRDHADEFWPMWNPAGGTICYTTNREPGRALAIGMVNVDGAEEGLAATGLQEGFGIAGTSRVVWAGETGRIITGEASNFHEYLGFEVGDLLSERSVLDGDDATFKVLLKVDGGGGSAFFDVSRDGRTALWRYSAVGGSGSVSLRVAPFASLAGGDASSRGRSVLETIQPAGRPIDLADAALAPDGTFCVVSMTSEAGIDLFLYDLTAPITAKPLQLTNSGKSRGISNLHPSVSPDGQWVAFDATELYGTTQAAKLVPAKSDLYLLRIVDRQFFALSATDKSAESAPNWAPDGRRIVFSRRDTREAGTVEPGEPDNQNLYLLNISEKIFRTPLGPTNK